MVEKAKAPASLDDLDFDNTPPVRPVSDPLLQWFNGLPTDGDRIAKGWHIERDKHSPIDEVCRALGLDSYGVVHRSSGKTVPYWALRSCSLFIITQGVQSVNDMNASRERIGLAYGWLNGKGSSKLKFRAIVHELAARGYAEPFTVSLEGLITREMLAALGEQFRAIDAFAAHREKRGKGGYPPYYALSLPLHPASQIKMVGQGQQNAILPMFAAIPSPVTSDYLREHLCPVDLFYRIRDTLLTPTILWSNDTTRHIYQGSDQEPWELAENGEAASDRDPDPSPSPARAAPRPVPAQSRDGDGKPELATEQQFATIHKLCEHLSRPVPDNLSAFSFAQARDLIATLSHHYRAIRSKLPIVARGDTAAPPTQARLAERCKALGRDYGIVVKSILKVAPDTQLTEEHRVILARTLDMWEHIEQEKAAAKATSGK